MGSRPDFYAAWCTGNEELSTAPQHHEELDKCIKAFQWVEERCKRGAPPLYLSPTELQKTKQV